MSRRLDKDKALEEPRLRRLLDHFAEVAFPREPRPVAHPLAEVLTGGAL